MGDRSDLVVVDGIRGILAVEQIPDLLNGNGLFRLELIAQRPPLVGVALESSAVQAPRDFANHAEPLGRKDRAVFHRDRDGDRRGATEGLTEPILGADIGMIGKEVARVGVDSDDWTGERSPDRRHGGVQDRIEEEDTDREQKQSDRAAVAHDQSRKTQTFRLPRSGVGGRIGHGHPTTLAGQSSFRSPNPLDE